MINMFGILQCNSKMLYASYNIALPIIVIFYTMKKPSVNIKILLVN